jgi:hypothetical protein
VISGNGSPFDMQPQDNAVLEPSLLNLLSAIKKSDRFEFVTDPEGFLRRLGLSDQRDRH